MTSAARIESVKSNGVSAGWIERFSIRSRQCRHFARDPLAGCASNHTEKASPLPGRIGFLHDSPDVLRGELSRNEIILIGNDFPDIGDRLRPREHLISPIEETMKRRIDFRASLT